MSDRTVAIIQHINITWGKEARGGQLAESRSRIARAHRLPLPPAVYDKRDRYIVQTLGFAAINGFEEPLENTAAPTLDVPFQATNCTVKFNDGTPIVQYEWKYGAPRPRHYHGDPSRSFAVTKGRWGRVEYNCRFSHGDGWSYEHSIINVAFESLANKEVFLKTPPASEFKSLADLW